MGLISGFKLTMVKIVTFQKVIEANTDKILGEEDKAEVLSLEKKIFQDFLPAFLPPSFHL